MKTLFTLEQRQALQEAAGSKKAAIDAMRVYLGSVDYASVKQQQRFHAKALKLVQALASQHGMDSSEVWAQAEAAARKAGIIRPTPGQHM